MLNALRKRGDASSDYDATKVNPDEFVDSETLLRPGGINESNSPYYVTVDADGTKHTVLYDPEAVREIIFKERYPKVKFTESIIYDSKSSDLMLPESADPVALEILGGGKKSLVSYFEHFSERCCAGLSNIYTPEIKFGESYYFTLTQHDLPYRFSEGDSRFLLIRLPDLEKESIPLRIRSFIRKHASKNIEKGVFFLQLVTLNLDKEPVRIMTGPLLEFQDETWTTHAYLQGIFSLSQTKELDERYVLINTTKQVLNSSSTIEVAATEDDEAKTVFLRHMNEGSFQIEILDLQ